MDHADGMGLLDRDVRGRVVVWSSDSPRLPVPTTTRRQLTRVGTAVTNALAALSTGLVTREAVPSTSCRLPVSSPRTSGVVDGPVLLKD